MRLIFLFDASSYSSSSISPRFRFLFLPKITEFQIFFSWASSSCSICKLCMSRIAALASAICSSSPSGASSTKPSRSISRPSSSSSSSSLLILFFTSSFSSLSEPSSASISKNPAILAFLLRFYSIRYFWSLKAYCFPIFACLFYSRITSALIESVSDFLSRFYSWELFCFSSDSDISASMDSASSRDSETSILDFIFSSSSH